MSCVKLQWSMTDNQSIPRLLVLLMIQQYSSTVKLPALTDPQSVQSVEPGLWGPHLLSHNSLTRLIKTTQLGQISSHRGSLAYIWPQSSGPGPSPGPGGRPTTTHRLTPQHWNWDKQQLCVTSHTVQWQYSVRLVLYIHSREHCPTVLTINHNNDQ